MPDTPDRETADVNWRWRCHTHGVNGWHLAPNRCCPDAVRFLATEQEGGPPNDVEIDLDHIRDRYDQPPAEAPAAETVALPPDVPAGRVEQRQRAGVVWTSTGGDA